MRSLGLVVAVVALAGCPHGSGQCHGDGDCHGDTCARDGECVPASQIRMVRVTWTVGGQPASATTCARNPDLGLTFVDPTGAAGSFGYAPVPCMEGVFTIDRIPTWYGAVEIGLAYSPIDANNSATLDLPP